MTADRTHPNDFNKISEKHGKAEGESVHQKLLADSTPNPNQFTKGQENRNDANAAVKAQGFPDLQLHDSSKNSDAKKDHPKDGHTDPKDSATTPKDSAGNGGKDSAANGQSHKGSESTRNQESIKNAPEAKGGNERIKNAPHSDNSKAEFEQSPKDSNGNQHKDSGKSGDKLMGASQTPAAGVTTNLDGSTSVVGKDSPNSSQTAPGENKPDFGQAQQKEKPNQTNNSDAAHGGKTDSSADRHGLAKGKD